MKINKKIHGFTLFEVVMVMALMSILISLVYGMLQYFQKSMSVDQKLKQEMNDYSLFRSTLFIDVSEMDSLAIEGDVFRLYQTNGVVSYEKFSNGIKRKKGDVEKEFEIRLLNIRLLYDQCLLRFEYKQQEFEITIDRLADNGFVIDDYFEKEKWKQ